MNFPFGLFRDRPTITVFIRWRVYAKNFALDLINLRTNHPFENRTRIATGASKVYCRLFFSLPLSLSVPNRWTCIAREPYCAQGTPTNAVVAWILFNCRRNTVCVFSTLTRRDGRYKIYERGGGN